MKKELYVILSFMLLLISCAEEGPYRLGKMESDIEISLLSPHTACLTVNFPSEDNVMSVTTDSDPYNRIILLDHPLTDQKFFDYQNGIFGDRINDRNNNIITFFDNLKPQTTYYVVLERNVYYNGSNDYANHECYYTGYSFTTPSEGDYSKLGEATGEIVEAVSGFVSIRVTLPSGLRFKIHSDVYLEASTSPDMSDAIEVKSQSFSQDETTATFFFTDLGSRKYYLRLRGYFRLSSGSELDKIITIGVKDPIDLSNLSEGDYSMLGEATGEIIEAVSGFVGIRVTLPSGLRFKINSDVYLEASTSPDMSDAIEVKSISQYETTATFIFTDLVSSKYYLRLRGYFRLSSGYEFDKTLTIPVKDPIDLSNMEMYESICQVDFAGVDFSIFRVSFPESVNLHTIKECWIECGDNEYRNRLIRYEKPVCYIFTPNSFADGDIISIHMAGIGSFMGINTNQQFDLKVIYDSDNTLLQNPMSETLFSGADYSLVKVQYPQDVKCYQVNDYYVGLGNNYPDSYKKVFYKKENYIVEKAPANPSIDHYLRVKGGFQIQQFNINGELNVDGKIKFGENGQNMFNVSTEQNNDIIEFIVDLADGFEADVDSWNSFWLDCRSYSNQDNYVFNHKRYNSELSSRNRIVFSLTRDLTENLKQGEKYIMTISGLNLKYGSEVFNTSFNYFDIDWTY